MLENSAPTKFEPQLSETVTLDWPLVSNEALPTVTQDLYSTSGPQNALRQTISTDPLRDADSQFPDLPDLRVDAFIDGGGMGRVYRAFQKTLNRIVAVKIITATARDGSVSRERFRREVEALAQITHPNIVPIYTAGEWRDFPFFTMKFVSGGPLAQHLPRLIAERPTAVRLMLKVARGLQALHERGIIHRDLKPLNILLEDDDEPVIADFGLAKWMDDFDSDLSRTYAAIGTKYYMSPEQSLGLKQLYGPGCDIWSFGVTLFELVVGERPFRDDLPGDVFEQVRSAEPNIPESIPADLATILRRCLQKAPGDRYSSAAELASDLECWLTGEPIVAVEPVSIQKPVEPSKRSIGRWIAAGVLLFAATAAASAVAFWPDSEKKLSLAERLRGGETVVWIGEKGLPVEPGMKVPGCAAGELVLNKDGYAMLDSSSFTAVEFSKDELPLPLTVSMEIAMQTVRTGTSHCGICFGRSSAADGPTPNGTPWHVYLLSHHSESVAQVDLAPVYRDRASINSYSWADDLAKGYKRIQATPGWPVGPPDENIPYHWKRLDLTFSDDAARASFQSNPIPPLPMPGESYPKVGGRVGVFCKNASVVFRNVTLKHPR